LIRVSLTDHVILARQPSALFIWKYLTAVSTPPVGQLWRAYYYAGGQRIAVRERTVATDELTYLHGDHLGSASLATDAQGGVLSEMRYTPYGETRSGDMATDRRYTGQCFEAGLGLYDPALHSGQATTRGTTIPRWDGLPNGSKRSGVVGSSARTVQVMREHPEYAALWPRLDELSDAELKQGGVDPMLHIMIHATLENQLAENDPPVTGEVLEALLAQGLSRHEALHRIGSVLTGEIFGVLKEGRAFDAAGYDRKLRELTRGI